MYAILIIYHFLFFWKFYMNPYLLCTSELGSTNFPFWTWMGKKWQAKDDIYYRYPACIPFLSMWYPPNVLMAKIASFFNQDLAFKIYAYFILGHYLLASFIAYKVLGIFGAITITYAGYCIKPQTPSFVYTMTWIPGMFMPGFWGVFSIGMAILGGYWPILVYCLPLLIFNPGAIVGVLIGLPQIIPFIWYWPKSIRAREKVDKNFGKLPWWKLKDLFIPSRTLNPTNGVHYPEVAMYMGIAVLFIWHLSWWWIGLFLSIGIICGIFPSVQRIPSRAIYLLTFCIAVLASETRLQTDKSNIILLFVQGYILLKNSSIYPSFPFSQWWDKPSKLYKRHYRSEVYPHSTGYLFNERISEYKGAFRLKDEYANR